MEPRQTFPHWPISSGCSIFPLTFPITNRKVELLFQISRIFFLILKLQSYWLSGEILRRKGTHFQKPNIFFSSVSFISCQCNFLLVDNGKLKVIFRKQKGHRVLRPMRRVFLWILSGTSFSFFNGFPYFSFIMPMRLCLIFCIFVSNQLWIGKSSWLL